MTTRTARMMLYRLAMAGILSVTLFCLTQQRARATEEERLDGYALLERGWVERAIETFETQLAIQPTDLSARLGWSQAQEQAGNLEAAWQGYQRVLQQQPVDETSLRAIGRMGAYRPEWQAAGVDSLTQLLERDPDDIAVRSQRARLLFYQGNLLAARDDYDRVLPHDASPETQLLAAQVYTYSNEAAVARDLFEQLQAAGVNVTGDAAFAYAEALRATGQASEAVSLLEQLQRTGETTLATVDLGLALARAYLSDQQYEQALAVIEDLPASTPALPQARLLTELGAATATPDLQQRGIALYQQVLATPEVSLALQAEVADVFSGWSALRSQATDLYRSVIAQNPDHVSANLWFASQDVQSGRPVSALRRLEALQQRLPVDEQAQVRQRQRQISQMLQRQRGFHPSWERY
ncbi:MAG: hypothetical protein AAFY78_24275 [Cyanobacteria bacterium J06648_16]